LPGDSDDKPSIIGQLETQQIMNHPSDETAYISIEVHFVLAPLVIEKSGRLQVRVLREDKLHRLGALFVNVVPLITLAEDQQPSAGTAITPLS
jgi:hypothetical protein